MGGAKGVVDVGIRERGQLLRKAGFVLLLFGVVSKILEEHDAALSGTFDGRRRGLADAIPGEFNRPSKQLGQAGGNGPQGVLRVRFPLGTAEVRREDHRGAVFQRVANRRDRRADTRVVRDPAVLNRDVEVDPDQDLLPPQVEIADAAHRH